MLVMRWMFWRNTWSLYHTMKKHTTMIFISRGCARCQCNTNPTSSLQSWKSSHQNRIRLSIDHFSVFTEYFEAKFHACKSPLFLLQTLHLELWELYKIYKLYRLRPLIVHCREIWCQGNGMFYMSISSGSKWGLIEIKHANWFDGKWIPRQCVVGYHINCTEIQSGDLSQ